MSATVKRDRDVTLKNGTSCLLVSVSNSQQEHQGHCSPHKESNGPIYSNKRKTSTFQFNHLLSIVLFHSSSLQETLFVRAKLSKNIKLKSQNSGNSLSGKSVLVQFSWESSEFNAYSMWFVLSEISSSLSIFVDNVLPTRFLRFWNENHFSKCNLVPHNSQITVQNLKPGHIFNVSHSFQSFSFTDNFPTSLLSNLNSDHWNYCIYHTWQYGHHRKLLSKRWCSTAFTFGHHRLFLAIIKFYGYNALASHLASTVIHLQQKVLAPNDS